MPLDRPMHLTGCPLFTSTSQDLFSSYILEFIFIITVGCFFFFLNKKLFISPPLSFWCTSNSSQPAFTPHGSAPHSSILRSLWKVMLKSGLGLIIMFLGEETKPLLTFRSCSIVQGRELKVFYPELSLFLWLIQMRAVQILAFVTS